MSSNDDLMSVKELAAKLKVTDALVKKLIKDFGIETQRLQKRIHLDSGSATTIREILALKASGKKNKEIKELFDAATKANQAEKEIKEETQEEASTETENKEAKAKTKDKKNKLHKKAKADQEDSKEENQSKNSKTRKKTKKKTENKKDEGAKPEEKKTEKDENTLDITSYLDENEEDEISMAMRLVADEPTNETEVAELEEEDFDLDEEDEEDEESEEKEVSNQRLSPKKARRRQFSFRYIQRQIANDAKRVQYIKQKLKRGRLSTRERMELEDSLEHRSKLHSGWVHLLRWVKS